MVDLTIEEGQRLKVLYGSCRGFHAADLDAMEVFDIYTPQHVRLVYISSLHTAACTMKTLFHGRQVMIHDTHTRRRKNNYDVQGDPKKCCCFLSAHIF